MNRTIVFFILFIVPAFLYSDEAQQTDWSGGDGILGPVPEWGNEFYQFSCINWSDYPGILLLLQGVLEHPVDGNFRGAMSVYSEDIDGDGDMDVLGAASVGDDITWWENIDGSGTSWTEHIIDGNFDGAVSVYSEDIDDDGDMDVLGAAAGADDITWWENVDDSGTSWTEHTVDGNFNAAWSVYSEDIDDDGDMDVLGAASLDDDITWWENIDGSGTSWIKHTVDGDFDGARSVYSEDIDGDGDMDVLGAAEWAYDITWWENSDTSPGIYWTEHTVDGDFSWAMSVYSEDIDGDGDMDILGASAGASDITWWENLNGSGTSWAEHTVDGDFWFASSVYSEDIDSDGDMDILGAAIDDADITWWENLNGSGTSWAEHIVDGDFRCAISVYSEDIDGDGDMDVLGAAYDDHRITWWKLDAYSPEGMLNSSILDTQCSPQWASIDWNSSEPAETDLYFQYKTSDDPGNMGGWSEPIYEPCFLSGLLDRYFQYKVLLETANPDTTPSLYDVTLSWDPLGIGETPESIPAVINLLPISPNPARGTSVLRFGLPETASVRIFIFDLSGRLVNEIHGDEYYHGYHDVLLGDFSSGIYFCRMISGDFTATQRFVVIE